MKKINKLIDSRDKPALVFGRENYGLYKDELALCETTVTIPTSPDYPVLNLSHAVGIVLYEINRNLKVKEPRRRKSVSQEEFERLVDRIMGMQKTVVILRENWLDQKLL